MKLTLPAILNPISRRKDKSVKLSFETRELSDTEVLALLKMEGAEGWLMYAPNEAEIDPEDVPDYKPEIGVKSASERLRAVIYVHYKQSIDAGLYVGIPDVFYKEQMEKIIEGYKSKNLHE